MNAKWQTRKLGEVCEIIMGQSPHGSSYNVVGSGTPLINGPVEFNPEPFGQTIKSKFTTHPTKLCRANDLILCVRGSTTGRMNISGFDACIGRGVAAIRARDFQPWINHFVNWRRHHIYALGTGATFPNVSGEMLAGLEIAIPPVAEQRRIVATLDEAFASIAIARANAERNLQNAGELFENHLHDFFARCRDKYSGGPLRHLCDSSRVITYGVIKLGEEIPNGVPCLRTSNVRWLRIDTKGMKRISPRLSSEYSRTVLRGGEVLVNVRGTLGGVAVVGSNMAGWNVSREVAVVPVDSTLIDPSFLCYLIGSGVSQEWLGGVKKGAAYVGINIEDLRLLPVHAPELGEQRTIVRSLDAVASESRRLEAIYQRKLTALDELKQALLDEAFSGKL